jgi:hypothetical protein
MGIRVVGVAGAARRGTGDQRADPAGRGIEDRRIQRPVLHRTHQGAVAGVVGDRAS